MKKHASHPFDTQSREIWLSFLHSLSPAVEPRTFRLMAQLRMVAHALHHFSQVSLATAGLSYAQYRLLMSLLYREENEADSALNPSQISDLLGTGRNTVSALIRGLEEDGLIERQLDVQDRRKFQIRLTEEGRCRVRQNAGRHFATIAHCFRDLTVTEQESLSRLLEKLGQSVVAQDREAGCAGEKE
jgi:MarR family transcriptional regulator, negative regulator of the multidrug operon emrRAB